MISICSKTNSGMKLQTSYSCYCLERDRLKRAGEYEIIELFDPALGLGQSKKDFCLNCPDPKGC